MDLNTVFLDRADACIAAKLAPDRHQESVREVTSQAQKAACVACDAMRVARVAW
jgi:hypothetical protein